MMQQLCDFCADFYDDFCDDSSHVEAPLLKMTHITQLRPWQNDIITLLEYRMTHINISS